MTYHTDPTVKNLRQVIRLGVYAVAIQDNQILLTMKGKDGCYAGLLDLPGGGVEFGENAEMTLAREFKEEVGMMFDSMKLMDNLSHTQYVDTIVKTQCIDNLSRLKPALHPNDPFSFHHLGQIYEVFGFQGIQGVVAEDEFAWYAIDKLELSCLTPFAKVIVAKIKAELDVHPATC